MNILDLRTPSLIGAVLVLLGSFFLGRRSGQNADRTPAPVLPEAMNVGDAPRHPILGAPHGDLASDDAPRVKGQYYLVIESLIPSYEEALKVKQFLHGQGVDATIHKAGNHYMLKDLRGFADVNSPQGRAELNDYVDQIERLGKENIRQGGKYAFRQNRERGIYMIPEK